MELCGNIEAPMIIIDPNNKHYSTKLIDICRFNENIDPSEILKLKHEIRSRDRDRFTALMRLVSNKKLKSNIIPLINILHDEIGMVDERGTTALMHYCENKGNDAEIIKALSDEMRMQNIEGHTALMLLLVLNHNETLNFECVYTLHNEIGMKNTNNRTALDLFCEYRYRHLNKDLANQIIYFLRDEYNPKTFYMHVQDIKSLIK